VIRKSQTVTISNHLNLSVFPTIHLSTVSKFATVQPYGISEQLDIFLSYSMMKVFKINDLLAMKSYFCIFASVKDRHTDVCLTLEKALVDPLGDGSDHLTLKGFLFSDGRECNGSV
jgi:hypothetical protein